MSPTSAQHPNLLFGIRTPDVEIQYLIVPFAGVLLSLVGSEKIKGQ
jgi:hypothetical protein